jgi:hypothetical protein
MRGARGREGSAMKGRHFALLAHLQAADLYGGTDAKTLLEQ